MASCLISAIPRMCEAVPIIASGTTSGGVVVTPPVYGGNVTMGVGKLAVQLPIYDPSNAQLTAYNFTASDVFKVWQPDVYAVTNSSGYVTSESVRPISSGGYYTFDSSSPRTSITQQVCASGGYNTSKTQYTLVTWVTAAHETGKNQWYGNFGAGGGCAENTVVKGSPWAGIAAVNPGARDIGVAAAFGAAGVGASAGGGGRQQPPSSGGCNVFIGVVTDAPAAGYGAGTVKKVTFNGDGTWTASGAAINVIFPRI